MTGERRAAGVTAAVVVLLAAVGVVALWPRAAPAGRDPGPTPAVADGQLAGARAAAALQPCPRGRPPGAQPAAFVAASVGGGTAGATRWSAPADSRVGNPRLAARQGAGDGSGPLAGLVVDCLGAPGSVDLGAALAGRTALVNVWASWCAPCRAELPVLAAYAARPGAAPVLGVDMNDDPRAALALLADLRVRLPSVSASADALRPGLGALPGLPMSFVVRADGGVVRVDPPVPFASADEVAAAVARLS